MVVEVGDHPIRSFGSRPFAVGDVVESLTALVNSVARFGMARPASRASSVAVRPGTGSRTALSSNCRATALSRCRIAAAQLPSAANSSAILRYSAALSSCSPNRAKSPPRLVRMVRRAMRTATTIAITSRIARTLIVSQPPGIDELASASRYSSSSSQATSRSVRDALG